MALRSPICTVVGHVDHGKTTLLDSIRSSAVANQEPGKITQSIGASIIPLATIQKLCGSLFPVGKITIPGVLFIDTPGHAAFTSLRKRGGSLADIAILLVDMREGFKPQTKEALEILRTFKTPFVIAANKLDLMPGYRKQKDGLIADIMAQREDTQLHIDTKLYELVGTLSEMGIESERFDRITNFQKQVAIVPISAVTKQGLGELLMTIIGLAQKFLEEGLRFEVEGPGKGVILEVKEEQGLGTTIDVILYDGKLSVGDTVVIGTLGEPIVTHIRALFEPDTNTEMRDTKAKFKKIETAYSATGVKISAPGIDGAIAGMPIIVTDNPDSIKGELTLPSAMLEGEQEGVIIKADTIGSIEALTMLLGEKSIPIHRAAIGPVSKKDLMEAGAQPDPVIIAFNVPLATELDTTGITVIKSNIIYHIIDAYEEHLKDSEEAAQIPVRPTKAEIMRNHIFRQSNPMICGMHVLAGELTTGMNLSKGNENVAVVKAIQENKENIPSASMGKSVAVSLQGPTAGRQVEEGDILYSTINEEQFRILRANVKKLTEPEKQVLREIVEVMRKTNPLWGL